MGAELACIVERRDCGCYVLVACFSRNSFVGATHSLSKTGVNALVVVAHRAKSLGEVGAGTRPAPTNSAFPPISKTHTISESLAGQMWRAS